MLLTRMFVVKKIKDIQCCGFRVFIPPLESNNNKQTEEEKTNILFVFLFCGNLTKLKINKSFNRYRYREKFESTYKGFMYF
jgi:hypothetical protein